MLGDVERLNGLSVISIEQDMLKKIDYKDLIEKFASKNARRMAICGCGSESGVGVSGKSSDIILVELENSMVKEDDRADLLEDGVLQAASPASHSSSITSPIVSARAQAMVPDTHIEGAFYNDTSAAIRIRQVPSIHAISQEENLTDCNMVKNALSPRFLDSSAEFRKHLDNKDRLTQVKGARVWHDLKNRVITKPTQPSATRTNTGHCQPDSVDRYPSEALISCCDRSTLDEAALVIIRERESNDLCARGKGNSLRRMWVRKALEKALTARRQGVAVEWVSWVYPTSATGNETLTAERTSVWKSLSPEVLHASSL
ncbi:hypothetical protein Tco_0257535 [Tanacetum coccineum]